MWNDLPDASIHGRSSGQNMCIVRCHSFFFKVYGCVCIYVPHTVSRKTSETLIASSFMVRFVSYTFPPCAFIIFLLKRTN